MNPIILDSFPFELDVSLLLNVVHVEPDDADGQAVRELAAKALAVGRPRALYREAFIEDRGDDYVVMDGIKLTSRVLAVNLEDVHRVFPYAATCGVELEEWARSIDDPVERFWADTIKETALGAAAGALSSHVDEEFRPGKTASMNPGSIEDWPMAQQQQLFALLGNPLESIGVELTDSFLMIPVKSLSGMRFPTEVNFESCQLCPRKGCPTRGAPYDPELFDKKYREGA